MKIALKTGEKIRIYRERRGLSQLSLEILLGASPGSLSRIENGITNPTKETLLALSEALELNEAEITDLFNIKESYPSLEDKYKIKSYLKEYFSKEDIFSVLLDNRGFIIDYSKGFNFLLSLLGIDPEMMKGANLLEVIFNKELGLSQRINIDDELVEFELYLLAKICRGRESEKWCKELLEKLSKFIDIDKIYNSSSIPKHLKAQSRKISFNINNDKISFISTFNRLNIDPRFELIDYIRISS